MGAFFIVTGLTWAIRIRVFFASSAKKLQFLHPVWPG